MQGGLTEAEEARLLELLREQYGGEGLDDFIKRVSPRLPPPPHTEKLRRLIERTRTEEIRAVVSMPPRHAKSVTLKHGIAWRVVRDPACLNAYITYGDSLSASHSRNTRQLALAGGAELSDDAAAVYEWRTPHLGGMIATGVSGGIAGKGINGILVIDDPLKNREQAESPRIREKVIEMFGDVAYNRLEPGGSIIVCQTRWHARDLIGYIRSEFGDEWEVVDIPAVHDGSFNPIDDLDAEVARALWPEMYPLKKLKNIRRTMGEYGWASLFQQSPRPRGANVFSEPSRFDLSSFDKKGKRIALACDPAASERTRADYSAIAICAMEGYGDDAQMYILHVERHQVQIPQLVNKLLQIQRSNKFAKGAPIHVESVGGFKAIPQMLRTAEPKLRITEADVRGDKFTRAQPLAAMWADGRVHVPDDVEAHPWVADFLDEALSFTGVGDLHDDMVDAVVHAHAALASNKGADRLRAAFGGAR